MTKWTTLREGSGFIVWEIKGGTVTVPESMIDQFDDQLNVILHDKLEAEIEALTVTHITVHITGNNGVLKCFNASGKELAQYDVTSGKIIEMDSTVKAILDNVSPLDDDDISLTFTCDDYTIKGKGPIPPGEYCFSPIDLGKTENIGERIVVECGIKSILESTITDQDTILVRVELDEDGLSAAWAWLASEYTKHQDWGSHLVRLTPTGGTNTYGRDGFYLHGGRFPGSAGCIDVGQNMSDLVEKLMLGIPRRTISLTVTNSANYGG